MARGTHIMNSFGCAAGTAAGYAAGLAGALTLGAAFAQAPTAPAGTSATSPPPASEPAPPPASGPHPSYGISQRVAALRAVQTVDDLVVIVPDAASYIAAIGLWKPDRLAPVLIDDGSELSREDIARFVRAFKPKRVLRWHAHRGMPMAMGEGGEPVAVSPDAASFASVRPEEIYNTLGRTFGAGEGVEDLAGLMQGWRNAQYVPAGLIVTSGEDPAWVAAMALSVGRGQAIAFLPPNLLPDRLDGAYTQQEFNSLAIAIEETAASLGVSWAGLGDSLDGLTLCANAPARVHIEGKEFFATGDLIGRHDAERKFARWAWAGQITGTASQAAYRAMCSLFLHPSEAWIFDGYKEEAGFKDYDGSAAALPLRAMNIVTRVDDIPNGSARQWRLRGARASTAGLIFVNTMGNADFFDLNPGRGRPGDVPILAVPCAVHMIHSWSLERPGTRDTLGGRWLERGAFVYFGSVNEPYLGAFVPPATLSRRLTAGMVIGAAVRVDNSPPWKVVCMGDPLYSIGVPMKRGTGESAYEASGATSISADLRHAMTAANWSEALGTLRLEGRDGDAVKLLNGVLANAAKATKPGEKAAFPLDAAAVRVAIPILLRQGATRDLLDLAQKALASRDARAALMDPVVRDAVWLSAYPILVSGVDDELARVLQEIVREDQMVRDVGALAGARMRGRDFAAALRMLHTWRDRVDAKTQKAIDDVIAQKPELWGEQ